MIINFVGSFTTGYVGETADEVHLARELEALGHTVNRVPRDVWKAYCEGHDPNADWVLPVKSDLNIICKWHHFNDGSFIEKLREISKAPVFYWVWDYMADETLPDWHDQLVRASDLYLGNDVRHPVYQRYSNAYYFPFDCADDKLPIKMQEKKYDVTFFGSYLQKGNRLEFIEQIVKQFPQLKVFAWNHDEWDKIGVKAEPPVWGEAFNDIVAQSRICLQFSVNDFTWGYWSNRTGKILLAGGFLLARYAPGMELFLKDGADYFSTPDEACAKIMYYLENPVKADQIATWGHHIGMENFSSAVRIKQLMILAERFIKTKGEGWLK